MSNNRWSPEARARQAELIRTWRPWERSTGPRSEDGKARASRNAFKGGARQEIRALTRSLNTLLREQRRLLFAAIAPDE